MPSSRALALSAVLLAASAALVAPSAASSQGGGELSFLGAESSVTPSQVKAQPTRGAVNLTLRNTSTETGILQVRFVTGQGQVLDAGGQAGSEARLEITHDTPKTIAPNAVQPFGVEFVSTAGSFEKLPAGVLVVGLATKPDVGPASIAVGAPEAAKSGFFQDSVETTVTRGDLWDKFFGGDDSGDLDVPVRGGGDVSSQARLVSSRNGHLTVKLGKTKDDEAPLTVEEDPTAGKYSGSLKPAGADPLDVTVHVQDWFLYPLIAILLGVLAGGYGLRRYETWRSKQVVEKSVSAARDEYRDMSAPPELDGFDFEQALQPKLVALRAAKDVDAIGDATDEINELLDKLTRWLRLGQALNELRAALVALVDVDGHEAPTEHGTPIGDTAGMLRERYAISGVDLDEATERRLSEQTLIIALYTRVRRLEGPEVPPMQSAAWGTYTGTGPELDRDRSATRRLIADLTRIEHHLAQDLPSIPTTSQFLRFTFERVDFAARVSPTVTEMAPRPEHLGTPAEITRSIRRTDGLAFALKSMVLVAAYFIPFYIGKEFGGWDQYVTAFAAGFAGTVALPWELFPLLRSQKPPETKKA
jgi:hypothetical protein